ncbi:olfactory receptor [Sarotherodon galilaeus]
MLLYVCFLLCVHVCHSAAGIPTVSTQQHTDAVLTCPHAQGDVTWSRAIRGTRVTLLTVSNGHVSSSSERFGSRNNNELLIRNVVESDTSMYLCNERKTAYLNVTTDPSMVDQTVTGRKDPDQKVPAAGADTAPPSDLWKVPVGVLAGAALVLLSMLTLRLWRAEKAARDTRAVLSEVVYEEIGHADMEPGPTPESKVENPYCCSEVSDQSNTSTAPAAPLYSNLCRPQPEGHDSDTCVYYLTQNPLQIGSSCQSSS